MPDPRDDIVRLRMRRQGQLNTKPEIAIRRGLHALGLRFRVDVRPVPDLRCRGDIVFTRRRVVIFVDGCFWHGCPQHATQPKHNSQWWRDKLDSNIARDRRADVALSARGWTVIRVWEHERSEEAVERILRILRDVA